MKKDYRGDTFFRSYTIELENGVYKFQDGDKVLIAFCQYDNENQLLKEVIPKSGDTEINVSWSAEEMASLKVGEYVLETEFRTVDFTVTHQENVKISEDFIYGDAE